VAHIKQGCFTFFLRRFSRKKDKEVGEGSSSGLEQKKPDALVQTESKEEEEIQQLE
jgi:hypothetical protein